MNIIHVKKVKTAINIFIPKEYSHRIEILFMMVIFIFHDITETFIYNSIEIDIYDTVFMIVHRILHYNYYHKCKTEELHNYTQSERDFDQ